MSGGKICYKLKTASQKDIRAHLYYCNDNFIKPLTERVNIEEYSKKIFEKATTFEAWRDELLIGLVAAYLNDPGGTSTGFITNVSVNLDFTRQGIATTLMNNCLQYAQQHGIKKISLEVLSGDHASMLFYKKFGFKEAGIRGNTILMDK